jgi:LysM repeat protein
MFDFPHQTAVTDYYVYSKNTREVYYKVKSGDTLSRIAIKNETSVANICKLNGISRNAIIKVGQTLRVN